MRSKEILIPHRRLDHVYYVAQHLIATFNDSCVLPKRSDLEVGSKAFQLGLCGIAIES